MSHEVHPTDLPETAEPYGNAPYLLSTSSSGAPRVNHVVARFERDTPTVVRVVGHGRGIVARLTVDTPLSLMWPQVEAGGFSLIADGWGTIDGEELVFTTTSAVLHRPAPLDGSTSC